MDVMMVLRSNDGWVYFITPQERRVQISRNNKQPRVSSLIIRKLLLIW